MEALKALAIELKIRRTEGVPDLYLTLNTLGRLLLRTHTSLVEVLQFTFDARPLFQLSGQSLLALGQFGRLLLDLLRTAPPGVGRCAGRSPGAAVFRGFFLAPERTSEMATAQ